MVKYISSPKKILLQVTIVDRDVFGSTPAFTQWKYGVTRINKGEITDIRDLFNKMTYSIDE